MKIDCGETKGERITRQMEWHPWFAWRPVRVGSRDCRWLERIERKGNFWMGEFHSWEYRARTDDVS